MSSLMLRSLKNLRVCSRIIATQERQFTCTNVLNLEVRKSSGLKKITNLLGSSKKSPFTWKSFAIGSTCTGLFLVYVYYLQYKKDVELDKERRRSIGKAALGGTFQLVNPEGKTVSSQEFLGQWILIYFGFTHCPDICPDELEKMVKIVDTLEQKHGLKIQPIFISVDPDRDTPEIVGKYCKEFSDKIIGLTGTPEQVAKACRAYRVYFSTGPKNSDNDYIVDHTIIMYLVDPDGIFVDYYGQTNTPDEVMQGIVIHEARLNRLKNNWWYSSWLSGGNTNNTNPA